jgi:hypothetical protein
MEALVQSEAGLCGICGRRSCTGTDFSPDYFGFPVIIIPPVFDVHLFVYHRHYTEIGSVVK